MPHRLTVVYPQGGPFRPVILTGFLPAGTIYTPYSQTLSEAGGKAPVTWSASGVPPGLTLNPSTGVLSGSPTLFGSYTLFITVTDSLELQGTATIPLSIANDVVVTTPSLPTGTQNSAYSAQLNASGGSGTYTWAILSGQDAQGFPTLNTATGALGGTPTQGETLNLVVQATDATGNPSPPTSFTLTVNTVSSSITIANPSIPALTLGQLDSTLFLNWDGQWPLTWSIAAGGVPGLTLVPETGEYNGTPTTAGVFSVTAQVTDANSNVAQKVFSVRVLDTNQGFDYYIGPNGSTSNNGTSAATPWPISVLINYQNVNGPLNSFQTALAGKKICILDGVYNVYNSLVAQNTAVASTNPNGPVPIFVVPGGGMRSSSSVDPGPPTWIRAQTPRGAIFSGTQNNDGVTYATNGQTQANFSSVFSAGGGIGQGNQNGFAEGTQASPGNYVIDGIVLTGFWGVTMLGRAPNGATNPNILSDAVMQNCECYNNNGITQLNIPEITFSNGASGCRATHNLLRDKYHAGTADSGDTQGLFEINGSNSNQWTYNTVYNVPSPLYFKNYNGNSNYCIAYNYIESSGGYVSSGCIYDTIGCKPSAGASFHHNVLRCAAGSTWWAEADVSLIPPQGGVAAVGSLGSIRFWNNTCISDANNSVLRMPCQGNGVTTAPALPSKCSFWNNIFSVPGAWTTPGAAGAGMVDQNGKVAGAVGVSDYNYFFATNASTANLYSMRTSYYDTSPTGYTLAAFKAAFPTEQHSIATSSIAQTALFTGSIALQYNSRQLAQTRWQLASGNPAINGGRIGLGTRVCSAGAWDGSTQQIGCGFVEGTYNLNLNFPLLGGYLITGSVQTSMGTPAFQAQVATLDVAVIGLYPGWSSGGFNMASAAAAIHSTNPACALFPYANFMELEPGVGASGSPYSPIYNAANASGANWFTRNPWPSGPIVDIDGLSQSGLNITSFTNVVSGQNYQQWRAAWTAANEYASGWQGVYLDNVFQGNNAQGSVDYRQTGTSVAANSATPAQDYRTGYATMAGLLATALPSGNKLVLGNMADWNNGTISGYAGVLNGGVMEHIINPASGYYESQGWAQMMAEYKVCMLNSVAPHYIIFSQDGSGAVNYAALRYGLCSCLLDNAYYYYNAGGNNGSITPSDEGNFDLGVAIAGPNNPSNGTYSSGGITAWKQGVWRRDFANGIVLVNPRGNGAQTVTLETTYWMLPQSIDTDGVNTGVAVTSVTLPDPATQGLGGSGLILSRTATG